MASARIVTLTAALREGHEPERMDAFDKLVAYVDMVEDENARLKRELAEARGDLVEDVDVLDAARAIVRWLRSEFGDEDAVRTYARSYMDGAYIRDARERSGPGHAKAMTLAARMVLGVEEI